MPCYEGPTTIWANCYVPCQKFNKLPNHRRHHHHHQNDKCEYENSYFQFSTLLSFPKHLLVGTLRTEKKDTRTHCGNHNLKSFTLANVVIFSFLSSSIRSGVFFPLEWNAFPSKVNQLILMTMMGHKRNDERKDDDTIISCISNHHHSHTLEPVIVVAFAHLHHRLGNLFKF